MHLSLDAKNLTNASNFTTEAFIRTQVSRQTDDIYVRMNASTPHSQKTTSPWEYNIVHLVREDKVAWL